METKNKKIRLLYIISTVAFVLSISALGMLIFAYFIKPEAQFLKAAVANTNVSLAVKGGALFFSQNPTPSLNAVNASIEPQLTTGTLGNIEVTDLRGSKEVGWTVNLDSMTDYAAADGFKVPLTNTTVTIGGLVVGFGDAQFVSVSQGNLKPVDQDANGTSDSAITLAQTVNNKNGNKYNGVNRVQFHPDISLTVPGGLPADTYTSVYSISVQ